MKRLVIGGLGSASQKAVGVLLGLRRDEAHAVLQFPKRSCSNDTEQTRPRLETNVIRYVKRVNTRRKPMRPHESIPSPARSPSNSCMGDRSPPRIPDFSVGYFDRTLGSDKCGGSAESKGALSTTGARNGLFPRHIRGFRPPGRDTFSVI